MHLFCIFTFYCHLFIIYFYFLIFIVIITNNITKVCITTVSLYVIYINILYKETQCNIYFCDNNCAFVGYNKNNTKCMVRVLTH